MPARPTWSPLSRRSSGYSRVAARFQPIEIRPSSNSSRYNASSMNGLNSQWFIRHAASSQVPGLGGVRLDLDQQVCAADVGLHVDRAHRGERMRADVGLEAAPD